MRSSLFSLILAVAAYGQPSPKPALSLSPSRLAHIDRVVQKYIDDNRVAGVVALVLHDGKPAYDGAFAWGHKDDVENPRRCRCPLVLQDGKPAYERAFGWADKEAGRKMAPDTIFRIASQTKAFTSAAVLALVEEGKIGITEPVSDFIPTFAKTTVGGGGDGGTVPGKRPLTVHGLVADTAGGSVGGGGDRAGGGLGGGGG